MREKESKPHQIAYNTLLFHYLHPLKRPNSFLVKPKPQNRKSCQTTARYMEEASLLSFPFPSCPARFLLFSPQPPCNTKRPLWWRELWSHFIIAGIIYHCCHYYLCNLFIMQGCRCITRANANIGKKICSATFQRVDVMLPTVRNTAFYWQRVDKISARKRGLLCKMPALP